MGNLYKIAQNVLTKRKKCGIIYMTLLKDQSKPNKTK